MILPVILVFLVFTGFSAAEDWVMFMHDSMHTGETTDVIGNPQDLEVAWKVNLTDQIGRGLEESSPSVYGDFVYAGSNDGVYCINRNTGDVNWSVKIVDLMNYSGSPGFPMFGLEAVVSSPAVSADFIYFGSLNGYVYCLDRINGKFKWGFKTEGEVTSSPAVSGDYVYVGSGDGFIYCIGKNTGELKWKFKTNRSVYSSPAVSGNYVYCGSDDNSVYCLDKNTGELKWGYETNGSVHSSPTISGNYVYAGSNDGYLYCFNKNTGELKWKFRSSDIYSYNISQTAVSGDFVYFGTGNQIYCADKNTGEEKWKFRTGEGGVSLISVSGDFVYFGSFDSHIYCLDKKTGNLSWEFKTRYPVTSSPTISGSNIYVNSFDGSVYAFFAPKLSGSECSLSSECKTKNCFRGVCREEGYCDSDTDCSSGEYCPDSRCEALKSIGLSCSRNSECETGNCFSGVCREEGYSETSWSIIIGFAAFSIILILIYFLKIKKQPGDKNNEFDLKDLYENENAEFKSSLRWDYKEGKINRELEYTAAKALAAFMNSEGGILLIGVDDAKNAVGLESDYSTLRKGKKDRDGFELQLTEVINKYIGPEYRKFIKVSFKEISGKEICYVKIVKSPKPVFIEKDGNVEFVIRSGNRTQALDVKKTTDYVGIHWKR
jgi:outer membrane protein assembly factor BamB